MEKDTSKKIVWKQLTVRVPDEVHRALKVRAAEEGQSVAVIIERLVREYLVGDVTAFLGGLAAADDPVKLVREYLAARGKSAAGEANRLGTPRC